MAFDSIVVNDAGVQIAYTDTGAPSQSPYITIVAIHGMCFSAPIFKRAQTAALKKGVRFVAINRRNYPGSTPFNEEQINVILNGSKEQKDALVQDSGHEIGLFIHKFAEKTNIPPISADGKTGGIVLLAWSAGTSAATAAIAHADTLPSNVRSHLSLYIRSLILQESHQIMFGAPISEYDYSPLIDTFIKPEDRHLVFGHFVSSYYDHGDITSKDPKTISWVVTSTTRPATLYNMSKDEQTEIICYGQESAFDLPWMAHFGEQLSFAYRKAFFDDATRKLFPHIKLTYFTGDRSPGFAINTYWTIEKDVKDAGKSVNLRFVPGANHFYHWDYPEEAIDFYLECS
ncbi:hypothetical protein AX15_003292 [Amanita polypyramis BW_CC]|nr:hypothetical protein AX15_003292 [Amanita polypyramis BW_CC]